MQIRAIGCYSNKAKGSESNKKSEAKVEPGPISDPKLLDNLEEAFVDTIYVTPVLGSCKRSGDALEKGDYGQAALHFGLGLLELFTLGGYSAYSGAARGASVATEEIVVQEAIVESAAAKGGGNAFRYMSVAELEAVQSTGLLRGGRAGETYFTKDLFQSAASAQNRLALPSSPALRVEFEILNNPTLLLNGRKVLPANGMMGKGAEFMTLDPVKVRLINWQPLR